jgi:hypothetical protein
MPESLAARDKKLHRLNSLSFDILKITGNSNGKKLEALSPIPDITRTASPINL